ncbi:RICIN domain-containing protein [Streptomyces sp. NPDC020412]|uniref:RICIN domain-containing protein n=1 Tax=Streptomyces sp. NPDC020412 TaxID=3365073 RepID=UPI0037BD1224
MSDQQKASGEPSNQSAESAAPEAAEERRAANAPDPGAGEPARSAGSPRGPESRGTESGAPGADQAEGDDARKAGAAQQTATAETSEAAAKPDEPETAVEPDAAVRAEVEGAPQGAAAGAANSTTVSAGGARQAAGAFRTREGRRGLAAAAGSGGDATAPDTGAPGRPGKPVLAGAAMVGAILVAVPLLIMATGKDEEKQTVKAGAAENVLKDEDDPAGDFVAESPPPSPTKSAPAKDKGKDASGAKADQKKADPPVGAAAPPSPSTRAVEQKAAEPKKKVPPSNLPAVLTRVLIKNNTNGTCVDIPGYSSGRPDTEVHHFTCNNSSTGDNQLWNVEQRYASAGPGGTPLFQIRNVMDSMCLDLPGYGGVGPATKVTEYPCNGTTKDNQLWWLDKQADGKFWIRNAASNNMCLDSYSRSDKERQLIVWPCAPEGQNNHEWIFTRS